jgi:zinc transporter 1/2/3
MRLHNTGCNGRTCPPAAPQVFAYMMELGCIFHSVLIGVGLGITTGGRSQVLVLLLALSFHQAVEGVSLGSVLGRAGFSRLKSLSMAVLYSLTTPLGIAIGIAAASSYDPGSVPAHGAVQGSLNGLAGGMLLYIALVQLLAEELSWEDLAARPRLKLGLLAAVVAGAGVMCVLAIWA